MNELDRLKQSTSLQEQEITALKVSDQPSYNVAAGILQDARLLKKKIKDFFAPSIEKAKASVKSAQASKKEIENQQNTFLDPVIDSEKTLQKKCRDYEDECARLKREEEAKAEAEAKAKEEEAKQKKLDEAKELIDSGDMDKAFEVMEEANEVVEKPQEVEETITKVTGLGIRRDWDFEVIDVDLIPREFMMANLVAIRKQVKRDKKEDCIPGIRAFIR